MRRLIILIGFSGLMLTGAMAQDANRNVRPKEQQRIHQEVKDPAQQKMEGVQNQNQYRNEKRTREQSGEAKLQKKQQKQQRKEMRKEERNEVRKEARDANRNVNRNVNRNTNRSAIHRSEVAAARSNNAQGATRKATPTQKGSNAKGRR